MAFSQGLDLSKIVAQEKARCDAALKAVDTLVGASQNPNLGLQELEMILASNAPAAGLTVLGDELLRTIENEQTACHGTDNS